MLTNMRQNFKNDDEKQDQFEELLKIEQEKERNQAKELEKLEEAAAALSLETAKQRSIVDWYQGPKEQDGPKNFSTSELRADPTNDKYDHQEENSFLNHADPMSEGDNLMEHGDPRTAILAYEAAVQKNPQDAKAWCQLGLAHAENEQDIKAIAAFNNCLKIEPNNQEVEDRYLAASRKQQGTPDASLQNALGVLYNLNRNFERAVDYLQLVIANRPEDARLWNRLGATLANADRIGEAIGAYTEAIRRYPTYVRARYNLGISCMHLEKYRLATNHFVTALEIQKGDGNSIWPTLRSSTIRMHGCNMELMEALKKKDLSSFKEILEKIPIENDN